MTMLLSGEKIRSKFGWAVSPALILLLITLVVSAFIVEFTFIFGLKALGTISFRFGRLLIVLAFPLFLLPGLSSVAQKVFASSNRQLIQVQTDRDLDIHPLKTWVLRPFQGIGLAMLMATKFLVVLQIYRGDFFPSQEILPPHQFSLERFLSTTALAVGVSILLSFLWTLDDLGIRIFNRKNKEVRMVGKYIGLLLPIFFGFYGLMGLFEGNHQVLAMLYVGQMVIILYPPFQVFAVLHARYLQDKESILIARLKAVPVRILDEEEKISIVPGIPGPSLPKGDS